METETPDPIEAGARRRREWLAALAVAGFVALVWWFTEMRLAAPLP